jgi:sortase A
MASERGDRSGNGAGRVEDGAGSGPPGRASDPVGFAMADPVTDERSSAFGFLLDAVRHRPVGRHFLSGVIAVLFISGAGMFTYPFFTDVYTNQFVQDRLATEFDRVEVESFDDWEAALEPGRPLTKIAIPDLGVETLVVHGTSPQVLRAGAGHYPNTPLPGQAGNVGIAGHRTTYGKPFNRIDELQPGDPVWLATPVGDFEYEVSRDPWITGPKDWSVVESTIEPSLTLTTCHPKGSAAQRLIVRAELVRSHPPGKYDSGQVLASSG